MEEKNFSEDENIQIETFKQSYNALYIKDFTAEKKQAVKQYVNNPVLERLIDNLEAPKNYMVDFIEGPISMTKLKLMNPRKSFYIFGEMHRRIEGHCNPMLPKVISVNFIEYIRRLSTNSPSFFDVYIELPMLRLSKPENRNDPVHYDFKGASTTRTINKVLKKMILDDSLNFEDEFNIQKYTGTEYDLTSQILNTFPVEFKNCIQPSTRNSTECNLMRIHNIDVRTSMNTEEMNSEFFYINLLTDVLSLSNININDKIKLLKRLDFKKIMKALGRLVCGGRGITIENMLGIAFTNSSVQKEIDKTSLELKDKIINFSRKKYQEILIDPLFQNLNEHILRLISVLSNEDCNDLTERDSLILKSFFRNINVIMMDIYSLSRIFKRHTKIYDYQSAFQPEESRNIIIYAGDNHSKNYVNFLKSELGAVETYTITNPDKSCIRTRTIFPEIDSLFIRTYITNLTKRKDATQIKNEGKIQEESFKVFFDKMVLIENRTIQVFELTRDSHMSIPEYKRNITMIENLVNTEYAKLIRFI